MVLDFLNSIYPILFIPVGIAALALGVDRILKKDEEESDLLKAIGVAAGLILLAMTVILAINEYSSSTSIISNYTILLGILLGMSFIARPFKNIPIAFVVSVIVALGLLYLFSTLQDSSLSFGSVPLELILIIVMVVVLIVYIISFIQEQAIDALLFVMGWGPIITVLGLVLVIQAITILIEFPNADGILWYLPG